MGLISLEHSRAMYRADFVLYSTLVVVLMVCLAVASPPALWLQLLGLTAAGLASWTVIEYALHRFVLHALPPFRGWHARHHRRPKALIGAPTVLSALLIVSLVFVPALTLFGAWRACALTLGVSIGYLVYATTHHAVHHWRAEGAWLKQRKRWHARHHHGVSAGCFGVTTGLWDRVFGTTGTPHMPTPGRLTLHTLADRSSAMRSLPHPNSTQRCDSAPALFNPTRRF